MRGGGTKAFYQAPHPTPYTQSFILSDFSYRCLCVVCRRQLAKSITKIGGMRTISTWHGILRRPRRIFHEIGPFAKTIEGFSKLYSEGAFRDAAKA